MRYILIYSSLLFAAQISAGELVVPNSFEADKKAVAAEVNENFQTLVNGINTNSDEIELLNSNVNDHASQITTVTRNVQINGENIGNLEADLKSLQLHVNTNKIKIEENITAINVGNGLIGGGASGDVNIIVDTNVIQTKLKNSVCAANEYVASIDVDGNVYCSALNSVNEISSSSLTVDERDGVVSVNIAPGSISNSDLSYNSVDSSKIQSDSVSSAFHISDEPGVTTKTNDFVCEHSINSACDGIVLGTNAVLIASVSVNAPAAGYILLSFSGNYFVDHTANQQETLDIEISDSSEVKVCTNEISNNYPYYTITKCNNSYREINIGSEVPARDVKGAVHSQMQVTVPNAGTYTYYVYGRYYAYPVISYSEIREHSFTAIYFPTSY